MISQETVSRLRWHAGFGASDAAAGMPSISECTWLIDCSEAQLDWALLDVIGTLSRLNIEANGTSPSEPSMQKVEDFPRELIYSLSQILRILRECQESGQRGPPAPVARRAEWMISTAWDAVLAGDIDDLNHLLDDEAAARTTFRLLSEPSETAAHNLSAR
jgi:hypothetical protein